MPGGAPEPLTLALFHSMFGLRTVEREAAARLRADGWRVIVPDLFAGAIAGSEHAPTLDEGFALMRGIGWGTIVGRARAAVAGLPASTILCGFSMGAGVIGSLWPSRPDTAGVVLLHAPAVVPNGIRPGTPVHAHVAVDDPFAPPDQVARFSASAAAAGAEAALHTYPGCGHFFTDPELPDYDRAAADLAWRRIGTLLHALRDPSPVRAQIGAADSRPPPRAIE